MTPLIFDLALPLGVATFDVFIEVALLDQTFYFLFKLVEIFCVVSFYLVELAPSSRVMLNDIYFWVNEFYRALLKWARYSLNDFEGPC